MLGLTSYQEALRAIGRSVDVSSEVRIVEHAAEGWVEVATPTGSRHLEPAELEELALTSLAARGERRAAGDTSDVLRSVGLALDQVHAVDVDVVLSTAGLRVQFVDPSGRSRELSYASDELGALRQSAIGRRNGRPLRRILILQAGAETAARLVELLAAEFAVQSLPTPYARAIAATREPPDLVLAQFSTPMLNAVRTLRSGAHTRNMPLLVLAPEACRLDQQEVFSVGADDILQEPIQPAQLRARIRTLLLRGHGT